MWVGFFGVHMCISNNNNNNSCQMIDGIPTKYLEWEGIFLSNVEKSISDKEGLNNSNWVKTKTSETRTESISA